MDGDLRLSFRRGDILAVALVILLAVALACAFLTGAADAQDGILCIYRDAQLVERLALDADASLTIEADYQNIVTVQNGRAAITQSDCPGGDCMHSGWISEPGRSIVCLPNRVELRIEGAAADVDYVVG